MFTNSIRTFFGSFGTIDNKKTCAELEAFDAFPEARKTGR